MKLDDPWGGIYLVQPDRLFHWHSESHPKLNSAKHHAHISLIHAYKTNITNNS